MRSPIVIVVVVLAAVLLVIGASVRNESTSTGDIQDCIEKAGHEVEEGEHQFGTPRRPRLVPYFDVNVKHEDHTDVVHIDFYPDDTEAERAEPERRKDANDEKYRLERRGSTLISYDSGVPGIDVILGCVKESE